jgi:hypothetical protein
LRDPNTREQAEAALLEQDLEGSPLRGKPLRGRLRNFRPAVDRYVVSLGGPLPYLADAPTHVVNGWEVHPGLL